MFLLKILLKGDDCWKWQSSILKKSMPMLVAMFMENGGLCHRIFRFRHFFGFLLSVFSWYQHLYLNPVSDRAFWYGGMALSKMSLEMERVEMGTSLITDGGWLDSTLVYIVESPGFL